MRGHVQHRHRRVAQALAMAGAALLTVGLATSGLPLDPSARAARTVLAVQDTLAESDTLAAQVPVAPQLSAVGAEHSIEPPPAPMTTLSRSEPVRLVIPSIDVDTDLMDLGLRGNGTLEVPPEGFPAGWFTGASSPGELGPAIIAGHVDWGGQPGVFFDLSYLSVGDEVTVERADGSTVVFAVTSVEHFSKAAFPTQAVYGDLAYPGLRLITCGGAFDRKTGHYVDNIVAFAELLRLSVP